MIRIREGRTLRIGILGGGLSALTLGSLLRHEYEILEKEEACGGLCRSLQEEGFTFDYGGCHILFSKDAEALNFALGALGDNCVKKRRNAKIFYGGRFVKYPFENGLRDLSLQDNFECLYEFIKALMEKEKEGWRPPRNFLEWCLFTFGRGIAEKYLMPYNEKIWKFNLEKMAVDWVGERVPQPPVDDIIKSSIGISTEGYVHQLTFFYPKIGGIQALIRAIEEPIADRVTRGFEVRKIVRSQHEWQVTNGVNTKYFDRIVSTVPIFDLVKALGDIPYEVRHAIQDLKYNRLITVMVGLNTPINHDFPWVYVPDKQVMAHRVGFPSNLSPNCVPEGKSSVLAEITVSPQDVEIWNTADNAITDRVIKELMQLGFVNNQCDVCYAAIKRSPYAYVINDINYLKNMKVIRRYFEDLGIVLLGRFSRFEYLNMDACIRDAMNKAEEINKEA
jgi:protoporphyrinogen oxidase